MARPVAGRGAGVPGQPRGAPCRDRARPARHGQGVSLLGDASYRSKTYQFEIPNPYLDQKGYALWDASIVYTAPSDRWTLGVYGKNLANKRYKTSGYTFLAADPVTGALTQPLTSALGTEGTLTAYYGNPRQVFATLGVKF